VTFTEAITYEGLAISEALLEARTAAIYLESVCDRLEHCGYAIESDLTVGNLLSGIDFILDEGVELDESLKAWLKHASGAIKGAVARGVTKLTRPIHRKLASKADADIYNYVQREPFDVEKKSDKPRVTRAVMRHSYHSAKADPESFSKRVTVAKSYKEPIPGTPEHAEKEFQSMRAIRAWKAARKSGRVVDPDKTQIADPEQIKREIELKAVDPIGMTHGKRGKKGGTNA
jgi:hypothetical protein